MYTRAPLFPVVQYVFMQGSFNVAGNIRHITRS